MVERSRPWSGTVLGDSGPYSDDQWSDVWKTLMAPVIASSGVFVDQLNDLLLAGLPATPVTIDTGRALVNGIWYENDASVSIAIPTPAGNPRVDRIVLRADWALQTVRLTRIAGAEAAAPVPPAITQVDGTTWDLPLWQVFITVGGVISTFADERDWIGQYAPTGVSETIVYSDGDCFGEAPASQDRYKDLFVLLVGGATIGQLNEAGFGSGAFTFNHDGVGSVPDEATLRSQGVKPDLINGRLRWRAKVPNTDANLDLTMGFFSTSASLTPADGLYVRFDGSLGGNWIAVARAGGVEAGSTTDTGQAPDDTWREFEVRVTGSGLAEFLIDGTVVATHRVNIPSDVFLRFGWSMFDDGAAPAANDYLHLDRYTLYGNR